MNTVTPDIPGVADPADADDALEITGYAFTDPVADKNWPRITAVGDDLPDVFPEGWGARPTERDQAGIDALFTRGVAQIPSRQIDLGDYSHTAAWRDWGAGWPTCSGASGRLVVVRADRSDTKISVHERAARLFDLLLDWTERPDGGNYLLKPGQCGGYNCRPIAGSSTSSNHAWGLAGDLNWNENPYTSSGKHTIPWPVIRRWNRYGFASGADYRGAMKDWMHLEFMGTPADADAMTALALRELGAAAPQTTSEDSVAIVQLPRTPAPKDWKAARSTWPQAEEVAHLGFVGGWCGRVILRFAVGHPGGHLHRAHVDYPTGDGTRVHSWVDPVKLESIDVDGAYTQDREVVFEPSAGPGCLMITYAAPGGASLSVEYEK